jgi:hypothetical protein
VSNLGRVLVAVASSLASLTALACALESQLLPGVLCVAVGVWFAARLWLDDRRKQ